jgi:hypothetical protein
MQKLSRPLLVHLTFDMLLGIIGIIAWGVGVVPQNAWTQLEKGDNLIQVIQTSKMSYAKAFKIAWDAWN